MALRWADGTQFDLADDGTEYSMMLLAAAQSRQSVWIAGDSLHV
jgi:hypothetical protein